MINMSHYLPHRQVYDCLAAEKLQNQLDGIQKQLKHECHREHSTIFAGAAAAAAAVPSSGLGKRSLECKTEQERPKKKKREHFRGNFAQIDLDTIVHNVGSIRRHQPGLQKFAAVVKANAYGHGAAAIASHLDSHEVVDAFVVAMTEEAVELREAGVKLPILVTAGSFAHAYDAIVENDLIPIIGNREDLLHLSEIAKELNKSVEVHLEVDVGMARLGVPFDELHELTRQAQMLDNIVLSGIMAHPSHAELPDAMTTKLQEATFGYAATYVGRTEQVREDEDDGEDEDQASSSSQSTACPTPELTDCSSPPSSWIDAEESDHLYSMPMAADSVHDSATKKGSDRALVRHFVNSSGIANIQRPDQWDMARIGLAMYGIQPTPLKPIPHLKQALSWFADVVAVRKVSQGTTVSYDGTWTAKRDSTIATISVGYADGYPRCLSNRGEVLIGGQRALVIGSVCMDFMMIDVTDIAQIPLLGTQVTLIGSESGAPSVQEVAGWAGTIPWEIVSRIAARVPRSHISSTKALAMTEEESASL